MFKKLVSIICVLIFASYAPVFSQDNDVKLMFERAWYKEKGERDIDAAIEMYKKIIDTYPHVRKYVAMAYYQLGECLETKGKKDEALKTYQNILRDFSDQKAIVEKVEKKLTPGEKTKKPDPENLLNTMDFTLNFSEAPIDEVINFISGLSGVNIILDQHIFVGKKREDVKISMVIKNLKMKNVLNLICQLHGLKWFCFKNASVVISTPERIEKFQKYEWASIPEDEAKLKSKFDLKLTLDFGDAPLDDVIRFLVNICDINVVFDPKVDQSIKLTFRLKDIPLGVVMQMLCFVADMNYSFEGGSFYLMKN